MKPFIIGLGGHKLAGKSTIAKELAIMCYGDGVPYRIMPFAMPLKRGLLYMHPDTRARMAGIDNKYESGSFEYMFVFEELLDELKTRTFQGRKDWRTAMQTLGTEWGREMIDQAIWTDFLIKDFLEWSSKIRNQPGVYIVPDVRFINEASTLEDLTDIMHEANDTQLISLHRATAYVNDSHQSEMEGTAIHWHQRLYLEHMVTEGEVSRYMAETTRKEVWPLIRCYLEGAQ